MIELNAAFNKKSNGLYNNRWIAAAKILAMHEQMTRLYQAAREMRNIEGPSNVARLLNESPQNVKNWEMRGVSKAGMLKAEEIIGCSALWLKTGRGEMAPAPRLRQEQAYYNTQPALSQEERELLIDFRELLPEQREVIVAQIRQEADHARRIMAQARARLGISEPIPDERVNGLLPIAPPYIPPAPISSDRPARKKVHKK